MLEQKVTKSPTVGPLLYPTGSDSVFLSPFKSPFTIESDQIAKKFEKLSITNEIENQLNNIKSNLASGDLSNIDDDFAKVFAALPAIKEMERAYSETKEKELLVKKMTESFQNSDYWQEAEEIVNSVAYSQNYMVDLIFSPDNILKSRKIEIRTGSSQNRHITPVGLIELIILNALQEELSLNEVLYTLRTKVEIFKTNLEEEDNAFIQGVFDFFKNQDYQTTSGITLLIKIIAHLYNQKMFLTMNDSCTKIPYKTHTSYLVPTLKFGGKLHTHKEEGSFIVAMLKILKGMENILASSDKLLTETQKEQVIYCVFSTFDYLPLPPADYTAAESPPKDDLKKEKTPKKNSKPQKANPMKNRYKDEEISRLHMVAATHLHFFFEAFPLLASAYRREIFYGFIDYLAFGVSEKKLYSVMNVKNAYLLRALVTTKTDTALLKEFTNVGALKGFYAQYKVSEKPQDFLTSLEENIKHILFSYSPEYGFELDPSKEKAASLLIEKDLRESYFRLLSSECLYRILKQDSNHYFNLINSEKSVFPIGLAMFKSIFEETLIRYINDVRLEEDTRLSEKCTALIATNNEDLWKNDSLKLFLDTLSPKDSSILNYYIHQAILFAYEEARKKNTQPLDSMLYKSIKLLSLNTKLKKSPKFAYDPEVYSSFISELKLNQALEFDDISHHTSEDYSVTADSSDSSPFNSPIKLETSKTRLERESSSPKIYNGIFSALMPPDGRQPTKRHLDFDSVEPAKRSCTEASKAKVKESSSSSAKFVESGFNL